MDKSLPRPVGSQRRMINDAGAFRRMFVAVAFAFGALGPVAATAAALEAAPDEWDKLQACERRVCKMILEKKATENIACSVTKTWEKKTIKSNDTDGVPTDQALKGDQASSIKWGFGDAQCSADLKLSASDVQAALTQPKHTINVAPHTVKCLVDRNGELKPVTATLAPRFDFKDGKAHKIWINLKDMDGPSDIKSFIKTTAKLEDSIGIFHGPMIKSVNKWMFKKCAEKYSPEAEAKAKKKLEAEQKKKAAENTTKKDQLTKEAESTKAPAKASVLAPAPVAPSTSP